MLDFTSLRSKVLLIVPNATRDRRFIVYFTTFFSIFFSTRLSRCVFIHAFTYCLSAPTVA